MTAGYTDIASAQLILLLDEWGDNLKRSPRGLSGAAARKAKKALVRQANPVHIVVRPFKKYEKISLNLVSYVHTLRSRLCGFR